jgi:hypothetical protein
MANYPKTSDTKKERKVVLHEEAELLKQTKILESETKKNMYNTARMSTRQLDENLKRIDANLSMLENLRVKINQRKATDFQTKVNLHEIREHKKNLRHMKRLLRLEEKNRSDSDSTDISTGGE